jgi:hypothetical protein
LIRTPGSHLYQVLAEGGDEGDDWTRQEHLLALVFDQLAIANWQRTGRKGKGGKPKPISPLANRGKRYGKTSLSPEEVIAIMRRLNPAQYADEEG